MPVRVRAWGLTDEEAEAAVKRSVQGWGRSGWEIAVVERLTGAPCPLDVNDPRALAAQADFGWAYAVYRHRGTDG